MAAWTDQYFTDTGGTSTYETVYVTTSSTGTATASTTFPDTAPVRVVRSVEYQEVPVKAGRRKVERGTTLELPDGSVLHVDHSGNFEVLGHNAKITYKGNQIREFNKYINASDLLEAFIDDLGQAGVKQGEVLAVPIEMFINWLIHKAAEQDGDPVPRGVPLLEADAHKKQHPRCKCCGRFIKKVLANDGMMFCNGEHYQQQLAKVGA